jgi:gamma-glutamylcyclotransferase (GGCT)/AIG2-like uncharacterized protein YtfP
MPSYYFAYGSNMNPARMAARDISTVRHFPGTLTGFDLNFDKAAHGEDAGHASVYLAPGQVVEGLVYELVHENELSKLDHFETTPVLYSRELYPIEYQGATLWSWVYIANSAALSAGRRPERWYLNHLLAGKPYLSENYYQRLAQWPCIEHDPSDRPLHL